MSSLIMFEPGKVFNPLRQKLPKTAARHSKVRVSVPARLNAMCFDVSSLAKPEKPLIYPAGELAFAVDLPTVAEVRVATDGKNRTIVENCPRPSIAMHSALLMREALKTNDSFRVSVPKTNPYVHAGFGSSSAIATAVAAAINEAYGAPVEPGELTRYICQNSGEELDKDHSKLVHVQSIGGVPSVSFNNGGVVAIVGNARVLARCPYPEGLQFVFAIPKSYERKDALEMMQKEEKIFSKMRKAGQDHSREIAWRVLHEILPAMLEGRLEETFNVITWQKFETGSLDNDSLMWPELKILLERYRGKGMARGDLVSYSSCGPAIYALTKTPRFWVEKFKGDGLKTFKAKPDSKGLVVLGRQA